MGLCGAAPLLAANDEMVHKVVELGKPQHRLGTVVECQREFRVIHITGHSRGAGQGRHQIDKLCSGNIGCVREGVPPAVGGAVGLVLQQRRRARHDARSQRQQHRGARGEGRYLLLGGADWKVEKDHKQECFAVLAGAIYSFLYLPSQRLQIPVLPCAVSR